MDTATPPKQGESCMEIATGYFARARQYADMGYALVSIAKTAPWFLAKELNLYSCEALNPTDDILALKDKPDEYEKRYRKEILSKIKATAIYHHLHLIAHQELTDKVVLMCYESVGKFCHRHIVAKWLEEKTGSSVKEVVLSQEAARGRCRIFSSA